MENESRRSPRLYATSVEFVAQLETRAKRKRSRRYYVINSRDGKHECVLRSLGKSMFLRAELLRGVTRPQVRRGARAFAYDIPQYRCRCNKLRSSYPRARAISLPASEYTQECTYIQNEWYMGRNLRRRLILINIHVLMPTCARARNFSKSLRLYSSIFRQQFIPLSKSVARRF